MKNIVCSLSQNKQRVAVSTQYGHTVFDLIHGEASLHDQISGDLNVLGRQDLTNLTTGRTLSVYIEAIQADSANVSSLLRNR